MFQKRAGGVLSRETGRLPLRAKGGGWPGPHKEKMTRMIVGIFGALRVLCREAQPGKSSNTKSVHSTLMARQKDAKRIGFLKTQGQPLEQLLSPLKCALLPVPAEKGCALSAMIEILQQWNLYKDSRTKEHYNHYKLLKDVLHNPLHKTLSDLRKLKDKQILEDSLDHINHLQTLTKQGSWDIYELMELQEQLPDDHY